MPIGIFNQETNMNDFYDLFLIGFNYLYSLEALPHIALMMAFFAILKVTDFKKGFIILFSFSSGILVNILLLGFKIFTIENNIWLTVITASTLLFALWNFSFSPDKFRQRKSNMSSRYLIAFILGLIHGIYIYFLQYDLFINDPLIPVFGYWAGLFLSFFLILFINFFVLWLLSNLLRVRDESWLQVLSGISIGIAISIYLTF